MGREEVKAFRFLNGRAKGTCLCLKRRIGWRFEMMKMNRTPVFCSLLSLGLCLSLSFDARGAEPPPEEPPPPPAGQPAEKPVELPVLKTTEIAGTSGTEPSKVATSGPSKRGEGKAKRERAPRGGRGKKRPAEGKRAYFGGLGYASVAPLFGTMDGFQAALSRPEALGPAYRVSETGLMLGGGGGGVFFGHIWLGGKGYALIAPTPDTPNGTSSFGGGGGGVELGYVIQPGPGSLLIPYFGLHGFGYNVEVNNLNATPMPIQTGVEIPGNTRRNFSAGFGMLEAALRFQRLVFFGGSGGLTAGFELGVMGSFGSSAWKDEASGAMMYELPSAGLSGMFVRLNIGGGGFSFR